MNIVLSSSGLITFVFALTLVPAWHNITPQGAVGLYDISAWKRDWPGCKFEDDVNIGRLSIVRQGQDLWWRVAFADGQIGPDNGAAGWRWPFATSAQQSVELKYQLLFEDGVDKRCFDRCEQHLIQHVLRRR